jgi:hypothetical protein
MPSEDSSTEDTHAMTDPKALSFHRNLASDMPSSLIGILTYFTETPFVDLE